MSLDFDQTLQGADAATTTRSTARARIPQVSLLPGEIRSAGQSARLRGLLALGVVAVAALVGAAVVWANGTASAADARSQDATQRLTLSAAQVGKFRDVQSLQRRIALGTAAVQVGGSTQIDWQDVQRQLLADMPTGFTVTSITADGATPFASYDQGTSPLERPRAATVVITADTASLLELPVWLRKLKSIDFYADALAPTVSAGDDGYTVALTVHLTTGAYVTPLKDR